MRLSEPLMQIALRLCTDDSPQRNDNPATPPLPGTAIPAGHTNKLNAPLHPKAASGVRRTCCQVQHNYSI